MAISKSTVVDGVVQELPEVLWRQAQRVIPDISLDEYSLARVIASEAGRRPSAERLVVGSCDVNRARRKGVSLAVHITRAGRYGSQGVGGRLQSSRLDPGEEHARDAMRIVREKRDDARGGTVYFNPRTQWACFSRPTECAVTGGLNHSQHPEAIVTSWSYVVKRGTCGRDAQKRYVCPYGKPTGTRMQWVGPIVGVDPWQLMVFAETATAAHEAMTQQALQIVREGIGGHSAVFQGMSMGTVLLLVGSAAVAAWVIKRGGV